MIDDDSATVSIKSAISKAADIQTRSFILRKGKLLGKRAWFMQINGDYRANDILNDLKELPYRVEVYSTRVIVLRSKGG